MPSSDKTAADLYLCDITQQSPVYAALLSSLTAEERMKAEKYLREEDRLRYVTGRHLIRMAAFERLGITDPDIRRTDRGKPYIPDVEGFCFSISHSGSYAVMAVSHIPIGADIEETIPIDWQGLSQTFDERARGMISSSADPQRCFYRIWTMREAFAKEIGTGLQIFEDEDIDMDYARGIAYYGGQAHHIACIPLQGYALTVCTPAAQDIKLRWVGLQHFNRPYHRP